MHDLKPFPLAFIWGVSSSGYQSEGGFVDSNWDRYNSETPSHDRYGNSVDFRNRYRQDILLAKSLGVSTFRIGINWARVEPADGEIAIKELEYYDDVIGTMIDAGIEPLITLDHFVYPGWIDRDGGWVNPDTTTRFIRFCQLIAHRYHRQVRLWLTFNEAALMVMIEKKYRKLGRAEVRIMGRNLVAAHRQAYDLIHTLRADALVSSNIVCCGEGFLSRYLQWSTDKIFLNGITDKLDYFSFDYYYRGVTRKILRGHTWDADPGPDGLFRALKRYSRRFPLLPILIAENGMPTLNAKPRTDGITRGKALRNCVYWMQRAHSEGVNIMGYMYWSLTDNFEWGHYGPRFGLYTVDVQTDPTLARTPTDAVEIYKTIIREKGLPADFVPGLP